MKLRFLAVAVAALALCPNTRGAMQTYYGTANGGITSGKISDGTLQLSGTVGSSISFTFNRGTTAPMDGYLVLFLDSTAGGYANTTSFTDVGEGPRSAITGYAGGSSRARTYFAEGFTADYALVMNPSVGVQLWQLGAGTLADPQVLLTGDQNLTTFNCTLERDALGMSDAGALRFEALYMNGYGSRYRP